MPSNKFKTRFPPARIKKIMQTDEEVGKVAAPVPVIVSKSVELFTEILLQKSGDIAAFKGARTLSIDHIKQCVEREQKFDFLREIVQEAAAKAVGKGGEEATASGSANISANVNAELSEVVPKNLHLRRSRSAITTSDFDTSEAQYGPPASVAYTVPRRSADTESSTMYNTDYPNSERGRMVAKSSAGYPSISSPTAKSDNQVTDFRRGFYNNGSSSSTPQRISGKRKNHCGWNGINHAPARDEYSPAAPHPRSDVFGYEAGALPTKPSADLPGSPFLFETHPSFHMSSTASVMDASPLPMDGYARRSYNPQLMMMLMQQHQQHSQALRPHKTNDVSFDPFLESNEHRGNRLPVYPSPRDYPGTPPVTLPNPSAPSGAQDLSRKRPMDASESSFTNTDADQFYNRYESFSGQGDSMNI